MYTIYIPDYSNGPNNSKESNDIKNISDVVFSMKELREYSTHNRPLYLGGDQGITLWTINNTMKNHGSDIFVFYLDSHADIHTEKSSVTKNRHGMVMNPHFRRESGANYLSLRNVVFYGLKDVDQYEMDYLLQMNPETHSILKMPMTVPEGANVHLAIDMDCMKLESGVSYPFNSGFDVEDILLFIEKIKCRYNIVAAEIVEYIPDLDKNKKVFKQNFLPLVEALQRL